MTNTQWAISSLARLSRILAAQHQNPCHAWPCKWPVDQKRPRFEGSQPVDDRRLPHAQHWFFPLSEPDQFFVFVKVRIVQCLSHFTNARKSSTLQLSYGGEIVDYGRLATFLFAVIFGGLLQLWVLVAILNANGVTVSFESLLADGGLFFFATSLVAGSSITLLDEHGVHVGSIDLLVTLLVGSVLMLVGVVTYTTVMASAAPGTPSLFQNYIGQQLLCTGVALSYWVYTGKRTGLFVSKPDSHIQVPGAPSR